MAVGVEYLKGKLLVAMPNMPDPRFAQTIIYMCEHSKRSAMGLIVNRVERKLAFEELLDQVGVKDKPVQRRIAVHIGGPVEPGNGFVLHTDDYKIEGTIEIQGGVRLTASVELLKEIAAGRGPRACLLALGYAGWGPGQLEREIRENGWLTVEADEDIVFNLADDEKWRRALAKIGIDPMMLSSSGGRA